MTNAALKDIEISSQEAPKFKEKKHFQLINKTFQSNSDSDYTEKIEALGKNFDYSRDRDYYWGEPEFSTFYGTPLYEVASESQKLALNHLYWIGQYHHTAAAEANTMLYNQVTTGVFANVKGYDTLCQELDLETFQERFHINTFQKIGYKTKVALLGKESMGNPLHRKLDKAKCDTFINRLTNAMPNPLASLGIGREQVPDVSMRLITKLMFSGKSSYFSQFLRDKGETTIPTTSGGLAGITASPSMFKFLTLNWGSSPFMASQYYSARMIANMSLKAYEHRYFKRYRDLEKTGEFVPGPTAVSYYHLLDESFHTTMSQTIAQEVYKDFPKPIAYEQILSNIIVWLAQKGILGGLSGALPVVFRDDACFMPTYYRFLTSPLFGMSSADALMWMERCLCQEHEGFHLNFTHQQNLLADFQRFFNRLDYLWPINREMRLMAASGSIKKAIQRNVIDFKQFAQSIS